MASGKGIFTQPSGDVYEGEWSDDTAEGHGEYRFANGDVYTGQFKDNVPNG